MSNTIEIKVPDIGDFSDIPVIEVLVTVGDEVNAEDGLVTLESDKATMEVPSPAAGVIKEMKLKLDDTVSEGDVVAILEVSDAGESAGASETGQPEPAAPEAPAPETGPGDTVAKPLEQATLVENQSSAERKSGVAAVDPGKVPYASPAIRKFARELGVDLSRVSGSGSKGRIIREDVSEFVKSVMSGAVVTGAPAIGGLNLDFPPGIS